MRLPNGPSVCVGSIVLWGQTKPPGEWGAIKQSRCGIEVMLQDDSYGVIGNPWLGFVVINTQGQVVAMPDSGVTGFKLSEAITEALALQTELQAPAEK